MLLQFEASGLRAGSGFIEESKVCVFEKGYIKVVGKLTVLALGFLATADSDRNGYLILGA